MLLPPGTWESIWISVDQKDRAFAFDPYGSKVYRLERRKRGANDDQWISLGDVAFPPTGGSPQVPVSRTELSLATDIKRTVTVRTVIGDES